MRTSVSAIVAAVLMTLGVPLANAQESDLRTRFEQELTAKSEGIRTIRCNFIQERAVSALSQVAKKEGKFYLALPSDILLSFSDGDYIKMTSSWFEMQTAGKVNKTRVSSNPMLRSMRTLLAACMAGDFGMLSKGFNVAIEEGKTEWQVKLTPQRRGGRAKVSCIFLAFAKEDASLNVLRMEEDAGTYLQYTFSDKQFNGAIDSGLFKVK